MQMQIASKGRKSLIRTCLQLSTLLTESFAAIMGFLHLFASSLQSTTRYLLWPQIGMAVCIAIILVISLIRMLHPPSTLLDLIIVPVLTADMFPGILQVWSSIDCDHG